MASGLVLSMRSSAKNLGHLYHSRWIIDLKVKYETRLLGKKHGEKNLHDLRNRKRFLEQNTESINHKRKKKDWLKFDFIKIKNYL